MILIVMCVADLPSSPLHSFLCLISRNTILYPLASNMALLFYRVVKRTNRHYAQESITYSVKANQVITAGGKLASFLTVLEQIQ